MSAEQKNAIGTLLIFGAAFLLSWAIAWAAHRAGPAEKRKRTIRRIRKEIERRTESAPDDSNPFSRAR
jgi:hypothetical protein